MTSPARYTLVKNLIAIIRELRSCTCQCNCGAKEAA